MDDDMILRVRRAGAYLARKQMARRQRLIDRLYDVVTLILLAAGCALTLLAALAALGA